MKQALYIPDPRVRRMVEDAKNLYGFASLRETVEEGMRSLMRANTERSCADIAASLQEATRHYLQDAWPTDSAREHKAFFDDLSGEA